MCIRDSPSLVKLSKELDIPLVATNDVHYVRQEDAEAHDILLAIQTATTIDYEKRMRFPNDQFYLKSEDEMRKIFAYAPEAIDNTHKIAMECNVEFTFGKYHLPEFIPPAGMTNKEYLRKLCAEEMCIRDRASIDGTMLMSKDATGDIKIKVTAAGDANYNPCLLYTSRCV